jgi:Uma2 family endonuclease
MSSTLMVSLEKLHGQKMTAKDYLAMERANIREKNGKYELFNKTLRFMAGASEAHNTIATNLVTILNMFLWQQERNTHVYQSDMKVVSFLTYKNYLYPDIVVVDETPVYYDIKKDVLTNPTLIIEVLSDETEAFDRGDKFMSYRQIESLREYILVSQYERRVEHFYKSEDGVWQVGKVVKLGELPLMTLPLNLPLTKVYRQMAF